MLQLTSKNQTQNSFFPEAATRFKGICSTVNKHHFHIFGCGAIGSSAAICLAKHNAKYFYLYDMDHVSNANIGISMYRSDQVDDLKVDALNSLIYTMGTHPQPVVTKVKGWLDNNSVIPNSTDGLKVAILAFDSMSSRRDIADVVLNKTSFDYVIDARMGREQIQVYTVRDFKTYEKYWYPDADASSDTCETKGTPDVSMISGSLIMSQVRKILNKSFYPEEICFHIPSMALECNTMVK